MAIKQTTDAVDVTTDQVSAEALTEREGTFKVDLPSDDPGGQRGLASGLGADVEARGVTVQARHRQTDTVDRDAVAQARALSQRTERDAEDAALMTVLDRGEAADVLDDAGEHVGHVRG